jgi:hypothetical protein
MVRLGHDEGMTTPEIDTAKDLRVATIKSRAWYAIRSLRLDLEAMEAVA